MNRWVVYGPCALSTVSDLSCGVSGMSTEKCPSGEVNFTQPLLSGRLAGAGVLLGVLDGRLLGVLDGRLLCSWALSVKLIPIVIMATAKNLFILDIPSRNGLFGSADYNHRSPRMTELLKDL